MRQPGTRNETKGGRKGWSERECRGTERDKRQREG